MPQLIDRFSSKYEIQDNGCWQWTAWKVGSGGRYGALRTGTGSYEMAHRLSYKLFKGPIEDGLEVRHKCDNGLCVNPDHLELGTHKQNMEDMVNRGRCKSGRLKFTPEERNTMRKMREMSFQVKDIAELFDCDRGFCSRVTRQPMEDA